MRYMLFCCVLQIIDGQQRLTTLVMLLGYLRAWAAAQPGMASLAERVEHMLHIPADPLNPAASARWVCLASCLYICHWLRSSREGGEGLPGSMSGVCAVI